MECWRVDRGSGEIIFRDKAMMDLFYLPMQIEIHQFLYHDIGLYAWLDLIFIIVLLFQLNCFLLLICCCCRFL